MRLLHNPKGSVWKPVSWDTENQPGKMPRRQDSRDGSTLPQVLVTDQAGFSIHVFFHEI